MKLLTKCQRFGTTDDLSIAFDDMSQIISVQIQILRTCAARATWTILARLAYACAAL